MTDSKNADTFMYNNPDAIVLFAAGNSGEYGNNTVGAPATFKNGITVGASMNDFKSWQAYQGADIDSSIFSKDNMAYFSSRGPTSDNRLKPDVVAPGWYTTSAARDNVASADHCSVQALSGTSMATPTVAGNAALIMQYFNEGYYPSGNKTAADGFAPSGALIKAMLIHSGVALDKVTYYVVASDGTYSTPQIPIGGYPSNIQGYGRIHIQSVLNFYESRNDVLSLFVRGAADPSSPHYASIDTASQVDTYVFTTSSTITELRITLVYTDPIAASGAVFQLVNDLEVTCQNALGETFSPVYSNTHLNNVEMIIISDPAINMNYTVTVSAYAFNEAQPYALVVTGGITYPPSESSTDSSHTTSKFKLTKQFKTIIGVLGIAIIIIGSIIAGLLLCTKPKNSAANRQHRANAPNANSDALANGDVGL
jgi:hypothetical protein